MAYVPKTTSTCLISEFFSEADPDAEERPTLFGATDVVTIYTCKIKLPPEIEKDDLNLTLQDERVVISAQSKGPKRRSVLKGINFPRGRVDTDNIYVELCKGGELFIDFPLTKADVDRQYNEYLARLSL